MHPVTVGHGHSGHDDNKYDDLHRGHVDENVENVDEITGL